MKNHTKMAVFALALFPALSEAAEPRMVECWNANRRSGREIHVTDVLSNEYSDRRVMSIQPFDPRDGKEWYEHSAYMDVIKPSSRVWNTAMGGSTFESVLKYSVPASRLPMDSDNVQNCKNATLTQTITSRMGRGTSEEYTTDLCCLRRSYGE